MSAIPVFIPYVNRPDLLGNSIASIPRRLITRTFVINNSGKDMSRIVGADALTPPVPLTFAQTQNYMLYLARGWDVPFYLFMHSDAEAGPETIEKLYKMAMHECSQRQWGAIFTAYDALAAFNTAAFQAIGGWDTALEWYASDADAYRRLRLAGYPTLESNLPVTHEPSQTLNSDPMIRLRVDVMFEARRKWYVEKWGGDIGAETFEKPFDGRFDGEA